jgi:hypothetical protein
VLPPAQQDEAVSALSRWAGVSQQAAQLNRQSIAPTDTYDPLLDKRVRL